MWNLNEEAEQTIYIQVIQLEVNFQNLWQISFPQKITLTHYEQ